MSKTGTFFDLVTYDDLVPTELVIKEEKKVVAVDFILDDGREFFFSEDGYPGMGSDTGISLDGDLKSNVVPVKFDGTNEHPRHLPNDNKVNIFLEGVDYDEHD